MRASAIKSVCTLCAITVLLTAGTALGEEGSPAEALLPEGLVMEEVFRPGLGAPVGRVLLVQGDVVIMHADSLRGYWAMKDFSLFKDDILVTKGRGRVRIRLNDESILTMASNTKIVLNKSTFDPKKKHRSTFLSMNIGKARFFVRKLFGYRRSVFKVKTPTAVCGVRGSDFAIKASAKRTEVTAFEDTELEIVSLAAPHVSPTLVNNFERTVIEEGSLPSEVESVDFDGIESLKQEFAITSGAADQTGGAGVEEDRAGKTGAGLAGVLVSDGNLVDPDDPGTTGDTDDNGPPDGTDGDDGSDGDEEDEEEGEDQEDDAAEEELEGDVEEEDEELPGFPPPP